MIFKTARSFILAMLVIILITGFLFSPAQGLSLSSTVSQNNDTTTYLPLIITLNKPHPSTFGVEAISLSLSKPIIPLTANANFYWLRYFAFDWDQIEAVRGVYNWSSVNEAELAVAGAYEFSMIATVKYTPSWAQKRPPFTCGAIKETEFNRFAAFLQEVVRRYSKSPYNIRYIQIGNEPDVDPKDVAWPRSPFGCWGDAQDYYFGGGYYAKMLKVVYPAIKAVNPDVKVVIGGLLLDINPELNGFTEAERRPGRFFEGILRNNGANDGYKYFDIVAFHGYPIWTIKTGLSSEFENPKWPHPDGMIAGKIDFLRKVMEDVGNEIHQTINKPFIQTEAALRCWTNKDNVSQCKDEVDRARFFQDQANYGVTLYTRNLVEGLQATIWYTIDDSGWGYTSLLNGNGTPKPVYNSLKFLIQQLDGTTFYSRITLDDYDPKKLPVYEFRSANKRLWVLWIADLCYEDPNSNAYPHQSCEINPEVEDTIITLPQGWTRVMDRDGDIIQPVNNQIVINNNRPYYIEFVPQP